MKKIATLLVVFLFIKTSIACLNEYHVSKTGNESIDHFNMGDLHLQRDFNKSQLEQDLAKLRKDTSSDKEYVLYNQNNIAVHLIKLGRLVDAKSILEDLIKQYPKEYNVIINLGTLFELMGENEKALEYIKKAMVIEPDSHNGSEWFHVKVLEYKLMKRNLGQIPKDVILDFDKSKIDTSDLANGVAYQLQERIPFTPAPDLMMAKILLEYGDFLADRVSIEGAYVVYGIAEEYDVNKVFPLSEKKKELLPLLDKHKIKIPDYRQYFVSDKTFVDTIKEAKSPIWPYFTGSIFIIVIAAFLWKRNRRNR